MIRVFHRALLLAAWWWFLSQTTSAFTTTTPPSTARSRGTSLVPPTSTHSTATVLKSTASNDHDDTTQLSRRQVGELTFAAVGLGISFLGTREWKPTDYGLWGILPVGTYKTKPTIRETIVPDQLWTLDQKFGILNVQVPVRTTIVKLSGGGLLVYNPVAATRQCLALVQDLVEEHGPVRHIVLGTVAIEHKVYAGVFAQKFPSAHVWLQPGQYAFPANLPSSFLGFPPGRTHTMPASIHQAPDDWKADLDLQTLGPIISRDGAFGETVLFHKPTSTLICTDTVLEVSDDVPAIYDADPAPLLYHARDTVTDVVEDTPAVRQRGWKRVVLFGLYFNPSGIDIRTVEAAWRERRPDINPDFAGIYPWDWEPGSDDESFRAIAGGPLVAPILQILILNRNPVEVLDFADKVAKWPIERIIPGHLKNNLKYTGKDYRRAFSFLEAGGVPKGLPKPLEADMKLLSDAEVNLVESGAIAKCPPMPGGKYSRAEILAQTAYGCRAGVCAPRAEP